MSLAAYQVPAVSLSGAQRPVIVSAGSFEARLGCGSDAVLMVAREPSECRGPEERRQTGAARQTCVSRGSGRARDCQRCECGRGVANGSQAGARCWWEGGSASVAQAARRAQGRLSLQPARPRGFLRCGSAFKRAFCAGVDEPLRRAPPRLPVAHHRLQLRARLPQHVVTRLFAVLLRSSAAHAHQRHRPTASVRARRLALLAWWPQPLDRVHLLDHRPLVCREHLFHWRIRCVAVVAVQAEHPLGRDRVEHQALAQRSRVAQPPVLNPRPHLEPPETLVETGLAIKSASPFRSTLVARLANGAEGYSPTPEHHALGGYETWLGANRVETRPSKNEERLLHSRNLRAESGS